MKDLVILAASFVPIVAIRREVCRDDVLTISKSKDPPTVQATAPTKTREHIVEAFEKYKLHLVQNQTQFLKECAAADSSTDYSRSCGNTVSCFMKLFAAKTETYYVQEPPQLDVVAAITSAQKSAQSKSLHAVWDKLARPHAQEATDTPYLFNDTDKSAAILSKAWMHWGSSNNRWLNNAEASELLRSVSIQTLVRFADELARDDSKNPLPRMFVPHLEWTVINDVYDIRWLGTGPLSSFFDTLASELSKLDLDDYYDIQGTFTNWRSQHETVQHMNVKVVGGRTPTDDDKHNQFSWGKYNADETWSGVIYADTELKSRMWRRISDICVDFLKKNGVLSSPSPNLPEGFRLVNQNCPWLAISTKPMHEMSFSYQNHVFVLLKHSNAKFSILQGYIPDAEGAHCGYDLAGWLCSRNHFASPTGFGKFTLANFFEHLNIFLQNGFGAGVFDGRNHAAMFNVAEDSFVGKTYFPRFRFIELVSEKQSSDPLIRRMVEETTPQREGGLFRESQCLDRSRMSCGKVLPGETLWSIPGSMEYQEGR